MKQFWLLSILACSFSAHAQNFDFEDPVEDIESQSTAVFVSPFQPRNSEAAGLASMMSSFLEVQLSQHADLQVVPLSEVRPVHDMSAEVYLDSCPPGQAVGCAFVVGENADAGFALTGTVLAETSGTQVEVSIIDVRNAREAMNFVVQLGVGDDERFAEGVASVLVAVVRGEAGRVEDIRDMSEEAAPDYSAAAAQLSQLTSELGDVRTLSTRTSAVIQRPKMTDEDVSERMQTEGVKPWERVNMKPEEYVRWQNSGENLSVWRERYAGRKRQMIVRSGVGFGRGPVDGEYNGSYVRGISESTGGFSVEQVYAWQSQTAGNGITADVAVGAGIGSVVEAGAQFGYASGTYRVNVLSKTKNNTAAPPRENEFPNSNMYLGPYVLAGLLPGGTVRPVVGASALYWKGQSVEEKEQLPDELETFEVAPNLWMLQVKGGAEIRLSRVVDFYVHVPVWVVVGGKDTDVFHTGRGCREADDSPCLDTSATPPGVSPLGAGLMLGLQVRLFGPKASDDSDYRGYDPD
jgi:hypothetical protein